MEKWQRVQDRKPFGKRQGVENYSTNINSETVSRSTCVHSLMVQALRYLLKCT